MTTQPESLADQYAAYADPTQIPEGSNSFNVLNQLIEELLDAEREFERLSAEAKTAAEVLKEIKEKRLPAFMEENHCPEHVYVDEATGIKSKITIVDDIHVSMPKDGRDERIAQIEAAGYGAIVKHEVTVDIGKDPAKAATLIETLKAQGFRAKGGKTIAPATLRATVIAALRQGGNFPMDAVGLFRRKVAEVSVG